MEKRPHSLSLSFVLLRFGFAMMACMLICCVIWFAALSFLESREIVYPGHIGSRQVEKIIAENPRVFQIPNDDFLGEYAVFDKNGNLIISNVHGKAQTALIEKALKGDNNTLRHTYADGSCGVFRWHFRKEFSNPVWRAALPPFEHLWWITLGIACILCWLLNAVWLRRQLVKKLGLFQEVSEKVGAQELDFEIPHAGIKEFDQALDAMERMRITLYSSLSSQWAAQQQRDSEMAALAHDLKTPITLIGGNAELLLEDDLQENHRKMVETILESNTRAKQYVNSLLETSRGEDEVFADTDLKEFFNLLCQNLRPFAQAQQVKLELQNDLRGRAPMQFHRLLRGVGNVVQNAIEYTPKGGTVSVKGSMLPQGWQLEIEDEGPGFSAAALCHGTERLWRGDSARAATGHNGLGLWSASQVVQKHNGQIFLSNSDRGGTVLISFNKEAEKGQPCPQKQE